MQKTQHYQLNQYEPGDAIKRGDFNLDNRAIDAALAAHDTALASKVDVSALNSTNAAVIANTAAIAKKAEQTTVDTLSAAVASKAEQTALASTDAALAALTASVGTGGSTCRIATGSYAGTGTYGSSDPTSITTPFKPIWLMIAQRDVEDGTSTKKPVKTGRSFLLRPMAAASSTSDDGLFVTWRDSAVSWYCDPASVDYPERAQNNRSGYTYWWVAIGV